ncbi:hypothetical protein U9M48_014285 [Paspalum notatum var. saurae]|uniref:Uncharacterized protein n=1 Tax=Paspalum notatum var. saurae TaxID=547442 RepID=A0AAQ3T1A3_PASNO
MGNCQAAEAAAVVIQHPGGKVERLYWSTTAAEVMRNNPGHYVALVILRVPADSNKASAGDAAVATTPAGGSGGGGGAKITRVKLLKPKDTLLLGQVYRLITAQEVTKALQARKHEKMQRCEAIRQQHEQLRRGDGADHGSSNQDGSQEKDRHRGRGRHWRPALQSISEAASQSSSSSSSVSESASASATSYTILHLEFTMFEASFVLNFRVNQRKADQTVRRGQQCRRCRCLGGALAPSDHLVGEPELPAVPARTDAVHRCLPVELQQTARGAETARARVACCCSGRPPLRSRDSVSLPGSLHEGELRDVVRIGHRADVLHGGRSILSITPSEVLRDEITHYNPVDDSCVSPSDGSDPDLAAYWKGNYLIIWPGTHASRLNGSGRGKSLISSVRGCSKKLNWIKWGMKKGLYHRSYQLVSANPEYKQALQPIVYCRTGILQWEFQAKPDSSAQDGKNGSFFCFGSEPANTVLFCVDGKDVGSCILSLL